MFANASGNNRASTVLEYFTKAAAQFGKSIMLHGISLLCYLCYVCNVVGQVDMFSSTATCIIRVRYSYCIVYVILPLS